MIKKSIATLILCISTTNYIYASTLLKLLHPQSPRIAQENTQKLADEGYTDFTGTWASTNCMGSPLTVKIENSSDRFMIDDEPMTIGTMTTKSNSGEKGFSSIIAENDTTAINWNQNKTQLIIKRIDILQSFPDEAAEEPADGTGMHLTMTHMTFAIDNGQLKIQFNTAEYVDLQRIDVSHPTCVFTKQLDN